MWVTALNISFSNFQYCQKLTYFQCGNVEILGVVFTQLLELLGSIRFKSNNRRTDWIIYEVSLADRDMHIGVHG